MAEQKYIYMMLQVPDKLFNILKQDNKLLGVVMNTTSNFEQILTEARLFFFEEYTDHGIQHIENVLKSCEWLIPDNTLSLLTANDISTLILSVLLHDIGMHTEFSTFKNLVESNKYDDAIQNTFDKKKWSELWEEYLEEAKKFSGKQRKLIFGNEFKVFKRPNLEDKDDLTGADKKLIGEFIRRYHPRLAHEIAYKGIIGEDNNVIDFAPDLPILIRNLSGLLARSHGIEIRETYRYLQNIGAKAWKKPDQIHIIYLMVVLRIADFIQIDAKRVSEITIKTKTFSSPLSKQEHSKHLAIDFMQPDLDDPETLYIKASPPDSIIYVKLLELLKSLQYELDISWAVLGEIYGKEVISVQPQIKYRRVNSNLLDLDNHFINNIDYVPEKINFQADDELLKLLIAPLYGDEPTYGVRELIQNAVDACRERCPKPFKMSQ